jgi:predicted ATP-grasp superfamily ATP-dependent carboligase
MRRAVAGDFAALPGCGARVVLTVDARWPDDTGSWKTIQIQVGNFNQTLGEVARQADYTVLIAPETAGVLAALAREMEGAGARTLGGSPRSIEMTGNKSKLAEWLASRGIPTPSSRLVVPAAGLPQDAHYPAVLKPVDGAGSVDTYRIAHAADIPPGALAMPVALLQPLHTGIPMSASFVVAADRAWLVGMGRQKIEVQGNRFSYEGGLLPVPCDRAESTVRKAVESVADLRGFVGVDFLWEPEFEKATVLEINPRVTTSFVGLSRLLPRGRMAAAWLAACGVAGYKRILLEDLAQLVRLQPPICFDADGKIQAIANGAAN